MGWKYLCVCSCISCLLALPLSGPSLLPLSQSLSLLSLFFFFFSPLFSFSSLLSFPSLFLAFIFSLARLLTRANRHSIFLIDFLSFVYPETRPSLRSSSIMVLEVGGIYFKKFYVEKLFIVWEVG